MARDINNPISPLYESTLADITVNLSVTGRGLLPLAIVKGDGVLEGITYDRKGESKTMPGSGANPRCHTSTVNKPVCEATVPQDIAQKAHKFVGENGICDVIVTRQPPGAKPVTDVVRNWKPIWGQTEFKPGDPVPVKITGNALRIDYDTKGVIQ